MQVVISAEYDMGNMIADQSKALSCLHLVHYNNRNDIQDMVQANFYHFFPSAFWDTRLL